MVKDTARVSAGLACNCILGHENNSTPEVYQSVESLVRALVVGDPKIWNSFPDTVTPWIIMTTIGADQPSTEKRHEIQRRRGCVSDAEPLVRERPLETGCTLSPRAGAR